MSGLSLQSYTNILTNHAETVKLLNEQMQDQVTAFGEGTSLPLEGWHTSDKTSKNQNQSDHGLYLLKDH
jgi:hypothetical protein